MPSLTLEGLYNWDLQGWETEGAGLAETPRWATQTHVMEVSDLPWVGFLNEDQGTAWLRK